MAVTTIKRSAMVRHSPEAMFDLVNDIEAYPQFMPGCVAARIIRNSSSRADDSGAGGDEDEVLAELCLSKAGISRRITTRNRLQHPRSITMQLERGDLAGLDARWEFLPLLSGGSEASGGDSNSASGGDGNSNGGCKVSLNMTFETPPGPTGLLLRTLINSSVDGLVDALIKRANQLSR